MHCSCCSSIDQAEFTTEMIIHFNALKNIDYPGVLLIQKVTVCLDCGDSRFTTPQAELSQLAEEFAFAIENLDQEETMGALRRRTHAAYRCARHLHGVRTDLPQRAVVDVA